MEQTGSIVAESKPQADARAPQSQSAPPSPPDSEARYQRRSALLSNPRTKWGLIFAGLVLLVAVFFLWRYLASYESTDDAQIDGHVNSVSARVSGHVLTLNVQDNQYVEKGTVLVEIDRADYADAQAQAAAAGINVPITNVSTSSQVSGAQAGVNGAQAGIAAAHQQFEAAKSQIVQAQSKLQQAGADLRTAGTAPQTMRATRSRALSAQANAERKKAELDQAELNLLYTKVIAPVSGAVSNRTVEVGQNVQPGQEMMKVIPLDYTDLWVTANFKETQLKQMKPGLSAEIAVDATGKTYKGHVDSIAGASGARFSLLPPENATGNYVKVVQRIPVKIVFETSATKGHELRPGMSVVPKVWIR